MQRWTKIENFIDDELDSDHNDETESDNDNDNDNDE